MFKSLFLCLMTHNNMQFTSKTKIHIILLYYVIKVFFFKLFFYHFFASSNTEQLDARGVVASKL